MPISPPPGYWLGGGTYFPEKGSTTPPLFSKEQVLEEREKFRFANSDFSQLTDEELQQTIDFYRANSNILKTGVHDVGKVQEYIKDKIEEYVKSRNPNASINLGKINELSGHLANVIGKSKTLPPKKQVLGPERTDLEFLQRYTPERGYNIGSYTTSVEPSNVPLKGLFPFNFGDTEETQGKIIPISITADFFYNRFYDKYKEEFENIFKGGGFLTSTDSSEGIQKLNLAENILQNRKDKRRRESDLSAFLSSLPEELRRGREEFLGEERGRLGRRFLGELSPEVEQQLNVRGLLRSGDLPSELARSASGLLSGFEEQEQKLTEEDDLFFQNAGYQEALRKEIEAGRDIGAQIAFGRQQQRLGQEQRFLTAQGRLSSQFEEELYRRQQQRSLEAQEARLRQEQERERRRSQSALFGQIGGVVGSIGGAYFGGPMGSVIGGTIGSNLGQGLGGGGITS